MVRRDEIRDGEMAAEPPAATNAGLVFIGRIHTPWSDRLDCLDGTPLLDLKPDRTLFEPLAPRQPGDDQIGDPTP